jgi:hypothetical protein
MKRIPQPAARLFRDIVAAIGLAAATQVAAERSDLDGVWLLLSTTPPDDLHLKPAAEAAMASYDPLLDDSDTECVPVSFTNIMNTPSPPFEIRQRGDHVEINYEFMDVRRRVPLDASLTVDSAPPTVPEHPHLGRSVGRYDGATLVVDTAGQRAGALDTFTVVGLPQSDQMRTEERFTASGDVLDAVVTHNDPVYYSAPLIMTYRFHRLDTPLLEWGCTVEAANYDERLEEQRQ